MEDDKPRKHAYNLRRNSCVEVEVKQEILILSDTEDDGDVDDSLGACGGWSTETNSPALPISITSDISPPISPTDSTSTTGYPQSSTSSSTDIASSPPRCPSPEGVATTPLPTKSAPGPSSPGVLECAICLQTCVHPARLPCSHIFCFLCLKGIAFGKGTCALCRRPIPPDYLDNPDLLPARPVQTEETAPDEDTEKYAWYYEGRHGWWQYDWRTCTELEAAYIRGDSSAEVLIAGYVYTVSFVDMLQCRKADPIRRRAVKRDLASCPKKGIAGLRINPSSSTDDNSSSAISQAMAKLNLDQV